MKDDRRTSEARPGAAGWVHRNDTLCPLCGRRSGEHETQHQIGYMCPEPRSPRTDYAPGEREALLALVHAARWVLTRHYNEHHESMRELKKMISNFDATQKRGDGT